MRWLLNLFVALLLLPTVAQAEINRIYAFGDSLSDTGNMYDRVRWATLFLYSYPAPPDYTRYRFTNGPQAFPEPTSYNGVWHEQLADQLGIPRATPSENGGNNFAFGGATSESGTTRFYLLVAADNLDTQTDDFIARSGPAPADALFTVWAGGNDLMNAATASNATPASIRNAGINAHANLRTEIIDLVNEGARHIMWPNLPPLEQTPQGNGLSPTLWSALGEASWDFRSDWAGTMADLQSAYPDVSFYGLDVYQEFVNVLDDPTAYGFSNITGEAQGANVSADDYLFWDELHPTTHGHNLVADAAYDELLYPTRFLRGDPDSFGPPPTRITVPEPAALGVLALMVLGLQPRRRAA